MNVLLGCTGSIGAKDTLELCETLKTDHEVKAVVTEAAKSFFDLAALQCLLEVFDDETDWKVWRKRGDRVLHIELRNWADLLLIAPLTANTLSKMTNGVCDNLLTTVYRAWIVSRPVLVAPSMNLHMWTHPLTARQISALKALNVGIIEPRSKLLAGGDFGPAAQADVMTICERVHDRILRPRPAW